jgi:hypothetical protein
MGLCVTTNRDIDRLRLHAEDGITITEAARLMGRSRYWGRYWSSREHIKFHRRAKTEPPLQHPAPDIAYVVRLVRTIERLKSFGRYGLPSRGH